MWLTMRGALTEHVRRVHRAYFAPMLTGYGLVCFEPPLNLPAAPLGSAVTPSSA
jgi:hypothetical protein